THFIEKLFKFDPATRITVEQALAHSYLTAYRDEDKSGYDEIFDFLFDLLI
ncbi:19184_t:CDS:2, partial [Gigaspora rosea]